MTKNDAKILVNFLRVKRTMQLFGIDKSDDVSLSFLKDSTITMLHVGDDYFVEIQ